MREAGPCGIIAGGWAVWSVVVAGVAIGVGVMLGEEGFSVLMWGDAMIVNSL